MIRHAFFYPVSKYSRVLFLSLGLLFLLGIAIRFLYIRELPFSYYHDEMDYVFTGEAVARYGTDITGTWTPWQLRPLHTINYTAELPALFHALAQALFGLGPQSGHLPAAFFGMITVVVVGILLFFQTRRKMFALAGMAFLAVSPWHIHISRMGYEAVISLFFQVMFITCVYLLGTKRFISTTMHWLFGVGMIGSLFFAYFTYHGAKTTALALVGVSVLFFLLTPLTRRYKWLVIGGLLITLGILLYSTLQLHQAGAFGARDSEILNSSYLSKVVDARRKQSLAFPGINLVINKPRIGIEEVVRRYFSVFDVYRLGVLGMESGFQFSLAVHGFIYVSTLPLIGVGVFWLYRNMRNLFTFYMVLLIVSPFTSAITIGYQSIFRSALTYLLLCIFSGIGFVVLMDSMKKLRFRWLLQSALYLFVLFEVSYFGYTYFSRYGLIAADNHYFFEKLLAGYVGKVSDPVRIVVEKDAYSKARALVAYTQTLDSLTAEERMQFNDPTHQTYRLGNKVVTYLCPDRNDVRNTLILIELGAYKACNISQLLVQESTSSGQAVRPLYSLSSPLDSGTYFVVVNDKVCSEYEKPSYVFTKRLKDFNPVAQDTETFCSTWMSTSITAAH